MSKTYFEVEVSNRDETVAALFTDLEAAKAYADDCESIRGVVLVTVTGPYSIFDKETVWKAYMRTWAMFNENKGVT